MPALQASAGIAFQALDADFGSALFVTSPPGDASRLFVVEQSGTVHIVINGVKQTPPFIDLFGITDYDRQERGLLGMAFSPDYATTGHFFLNYTRTESGQIQTVVARFTANGSPATATTASLASQQIKLVVEQPYDNHNGGMMAFGPDGYLYIAFGDGGSAFDPENRSQDLNSYMGKILRVDASGEGSFAAAPGNPFIGPTPGLDEIWAYGLRNPWRFSFDRTTGDLWVADVGQQETEEVNVIPAGSPGGANLGWRAFEGNDCNIPAECAPIADQVNFPIYTYSHPNSEARAIVGGYVYRGSGIPSLQGAYLFGDYTQGTVGFLRYTPGPEPQVEVRDLTPIFNPAGHICCLTSFGEDAAGELYVVTQFKVYRIYDDGETYIDLQKVGDFDEPLYATSPPGDASRLLIGQKNGIIHLVKDGARQETPFLDITDRVATEGELGLLGFTLHPQFATNGYLFTNYLRLTGPENDVMETVIARFTATGDPATAVTADPASELILLTIEQPKDDHDGGGLAFSPLDGYLYIPLGDGGCCNDVFGHAQDLGSLLGKILRIDVDNTDPGLNYAIPDDNPFISIPGARDEIWALGLRNPFRGSFDALTGDFYFGDVGQEHFEEVSFQPGESTGGENYGWPRFEGTRCNTDVVTQQTCNAFEEFDTPPIWDYDREFGGCVIGGSVYRGSAMPGLQGRYIYADFFNPRVYSFVEDNGVATLHREFTEDLDAKRELLEGIVSVSEDGVGELYICCYTGAVYKIVPGLGDDSEDRDDEEGEGEEPLDPLGVPVTLGAQKDATLYEDPLGAAANGTGPNVFAGRTGDNGDTARRRALLKFDLAGALPPDAEIQSVALRLRCSKLPVGGEDTDITVHRVLTDWNEGPTDPGGVGGFGGPSATGDVTWLHTRYNTQLWSSPGGDFVAEASGATAVNTLAHHTWTGDGMRNDVMAWLDNPETNHGWMLMGDETLLKTARRFDSREHGTITNRPQLTIRYCGTPQDGWVFNAANGHWYRVSEALTFSDAEAQAACVGGYVATISSNAENAFVLANLATAGNGWIGFNDVDQEGVFSWSNGETTLYQNWGDSEPAGGDAEDGVLLNQSDGKWANVDATQTAIAFIERDTTPFIFEGEGDVDGADGEGEGDGIADGEGDGAAEGEGEGVVDGEGDGNADGEGDGIVDGEGEGEGAEDPASAGIEGFDAGDINNDRRLNQAEALTLGIGPIAFDALDLNNDTLLSPAELLLAAGDDAPAHSADINLDKRIAMSELLRVIQFYNADGYRCAPAANSEDGYLPTPFTGTGPDPACTTHASDFAPADGAVSLSELLRLIQLFSFNGYAPCGSVEDGFCEGP